MAWPRRRYIAHTIQRHNVLHVASCSEKTSKRRSNAKAERRALGETCRNDLEMKSDTPPYRTQMAWSIPGIEREGDLQTVRL